MIHPDMTIPSTDAKTFAEWVGHRLDSHPNPHRLESHYLLMVKLAMQPGISSTSRNLLSWECAKAAAHWRRIAQERDAKGKVN